MQTITIDIINNKALKLLKDLEQLQLIRLHKEPQKSKLESNFVTKYKGALSKQSVNEIDKQLKELREGWD